MLPLAYSDMWSLHRSYVLLCPTNSLPRGFFIAHSPLYTLLRSLTLISTRLSSYASCLDTVLPSLHLHAAKLKTRSILKLSLAMCHSCWMSALLSVAPTVAFTTLLTQCTPYLPLIPTVMPATFINPSPPPPTRCPNLPPQSCQPEV